ncbi:MAG: hypothetical protein EBU46_11560 [Nitrosomonadaceae bacterium]|nr:hypothetical protein [Nitrosomonadaceae bacterium]
MKLGIDIHGVIDANRPLFAELTQLLKFHNEHLGGKHEVHILTGPRVKDLKPDELADIWYTHIFSIVDYHIAKGTPVEWVGDRAWMSDYDWDRTKADYAREHQLDLTIDDSETYQHFFSTPYMIFKPRVNWRQNAAKERHRNGKV